MNYESVPKIALIVGIIAIICSATAIYVATVEDDTNGEMIEKYTLYFGLNDTTEEDAKITQGKIGDLVGRVCETGFTTYLASGGSYIDGAILKNDFTGIFIITLVSDEKITELMNAANEELGITVILKEKYLTEEELILF